MVVGAELLAGTVAVGYVMGWYGQQQQKDLPGTHLNNTITKSGRRSKRQRVLTKIQQKQARLAVRRARSQP